MTEIRKTYRKIDKRHTKKIDRLRYWDSDRDTLRHRERPRSGTRESEIANNYG